MNDKSALRTVRCGTEDVMVFTFNGRPAVSVAQLSRALKWKDNANTLRMSIAQWGEVLGADKAFADVTSDDDRKAVRIQTGGRIGSSKDTRIAFLHGVDMVCAKSTNPMAPAIRDALVGAMLFSPEDARQWKCPPHVMPPDAAPAATRDTDPMYDRLDRILGTVGQMVGQLTATVALLDAIVKRVPRAPARTRKTTPAPPD